MSEDLNEAQRPESYVMKKLSRQSGNTHQRSKMKVDDKASDEIMKALSCSDIDPETREQWVKYLIDFYVSKSHNKLEPVGYISGQSNTETYSLTNLQFKDGMNFKDAIEQQYGVYARF